ncbi:glycosyltransferase [Paludibacter sp. 221]|uniref:glycosyltransferase n=1 Tax=Paludibacter sp. 221 TaxID=2302939 RepID=UPI0013D3C85F|nr:glycosyltransferase [Paludibacter sp. 221]NDV46038.1 glycosyltransferase [Paludibacter sp. 221]
MRILIVASYNSGEFSAFVIEQTKELEKLGVEIDFYGKIGNGYKGYLRNRKQLIQKVKVFQPDIIHAHYGLSGLLANLQRKVPVVTTYHGSDINNDSIFRFSKIAIYLSAFNIFVSEKNRQKTKLNKNQVVIPCGVDVELFKPIEKKIAREKFGFTKDDKIVLFAGAFDNKVKNVELAKKAIGVIPNIKLIELKGYSREEVAELMNAVDAVLMTSFSEGSPQFIKEAMACNKPIVSVDVGDVKEIMGDTEGCYLAERTPEDIAEKLRQALNFSRPTIGRKRIIELGVDSETVAKKIIDIYKTIINANQ